MAVWRRSLRADTEKNRADAAERKAEAAERELARLRVTA